MKSEDFLKYLLPEGMLRYFEVKNVEEVMEVITIHLEEKNIKPEGYQGVLTSKGFYDPIAIQDFPLRGKACYLKVRRRRWTVEDTGQIISRNWDIVAKGTRITEEFASFLKEVNRLQSR